MILSFEQVLGKLLIARRGFHGDCARGQIVSDSRKVLPGDIFVAIPGTVSDGHNYIDAAIQALSHTPLPDLVIIGRLKRKKLALKDEITRVEDYLTPDIIA